MLRTIGVVAAVLAALSVGACQKVLTEAQYREWVAYLRENPEGLDRVIEECSKARFTKDDRRALKVLGVTLGFKTENITEKALCANSFKAMASGRLTYEDVALIYKSHQQ